MFLDAFWLALLVKIAATVAVVIAASAAAERGGPFWGGLVCALPIGAGPGYVLLALQADAGFVETSALASLGTNIASSVFMTAVVWLAPRRSAVATLAIAIAAWAALMLPLRWIPWTGATAMLANLTAVAVACWLTAGADRGIAIRATPPRWFDLPVRALVIGLVVVGVVTVSDAIGPRWTGIAMVFPIATASLTAVVHRRLGGPAAAATMATALRAMPGFLSALLMIHVLARVNLIVAFVAALASSIAWAIGMMLWRAYARPALSPAP
jgi:hypothetical protein